jgi:hypothetical protein
MVTPQAKINIRVAPVAMLNRRASFAYINGIAIVISDIDKWTDELVLEFIEGQAVLAGNQSAIANITHFFGEVFGASHRKLIVEWIAKKGLTPSAKTAMVTDSVLMRAALTAYSMLTKTRAKAFEPKDMLAMCNWITEGTDISPDEVKTSLETCYKLIGKKIVS